WPWTRAACWPRSPRPVRAEALLVGLASVVLLGCATVPLLVPSEVRAGLRLSRPLGKCLPRALELGDSEDLGRGSTQGSRYRGKLAATASTLQSHAIRLFEPEAENGGLFFDVVTAEQRCADGTIYFVVRCADFRTTSDAAKPR